MFKIRIPATTANIGPGFDVFGMALNYYNYITVEEADTLCVELEGEGACELNNQRGNLIVRAAQAVYDELGKGKINMSIATTNNIPLSRGMGSSSAAIVGGIMAANVLSGNLLPMEEMLKLATKLEGHPDNVVPAFLGGFVAMSYDRGQLITLKIIPPVKLKMVVVVPAIKVSTSAARAILPEQVSLEDAVFNVSHASLLTGALATGNLQLFGQALQDRLHQPYRYSLIPGAEKVVANALNKGALGCVISGSGPSMLAFTNGNEYAIGESMSSVFKKQGIESKVLKLVVDIDGAKILSD